MNTKMTVLAMALVMVLPLVAQGEKEHHPDQAGRPKAAAGQQGAGPMTMERMHTHMQKMMHQMEKIHATKDTEKRERLMDEHMRTMQEGMGMMRGMGGPMTMGDKMKGAGQDMDMSQRMGMMEQRMEMMQMMMEQMAGSQKEERSMRRHDHRKFHKQ
jgi:hypothetical protein